MPNRLETGSSPRGNEINKNPRGLIGQQVLFNNGPVGPAVEALPHFISVLSPGKSDFPNGRAIIVSLDDGRLVCAAKTNKSDKAKAVEASKRFRMVGEEIEVWYGSADSTKSWKTHLEKLEEKKVLHLRNLYHGLGINDLSLIYPEDLSPEAREKLGIKEDIPSATLPWKASQKEGEEVKKREGRKGPLSAKVVRMLSAVAVAAVGIQGAKAAKAEGDNNLFGETAVIVKTDNGEVNTEDNTELKMAVVPLEEVLASPEAQGEKLSVLTGAELTEQVHAYYEGTDTPQILIENAYSQTQEAYVKLGLPSDPETNPLFPDIVFTVGQKTTYNPTTGELQSGTERAYYWNYSYGYFAKSENGLLGLKKIPDVWLGEDKLLPHVSGSGNEAKIDLFDIYGRKVATFGSMADFSQEDNPIGLLRVLGVNGGIGALKVQIAGYGGKLEGGGEVNSEVVEANGAMPVESEEYHNFILPLNERQSLVVSLPKTSIPPGGASFTYNTEKERFEVKSVADATNYGIVDKGDNFWFIGTPKSSSINIRQFPTTSSEIVGQYTSGQEILIVGKVQEGAYFWYKTSSGGYVRDDVANVYNLYLIPDYDDPPEPPGEKVILLPLVEASAGRDVKNINIGVPSESFLNRLGMTLDEVSAANFVIEGYSDTGEANKVKVYGAQNNPSIVAEYNSVSQRWEWKDAVLEGVSLSTSLLNPNGEWVFKPATEQLEQIGIAEFEDGLITIDVKRTPRIAGEEGDEVIGVVVRLVNPASNQALVAIRSKEEDGLGWREEGLGLAVKRITGVDFGFATSYYSQVLTDPKGREFMIANASTITPESQAEWRNLVTTGNYDEKNNKWSLSYKWSALDSDIYFAQVTGKEVYIHPLIDTYPERMGGFMGVINQDLESLAQNLGDNALREVVRKKYLALAREHIQQVHDRYDGIVSRFTLLNELRSRPDNFWKKLIGEDYIEQIYSIANEIDPDVAWVWNEWNRWDDQVTESYNDFYAGFANLIEQKRAAGAKIEHIGIQAHISTGDRSNIYNGFYNFFVRMADLGITVYITELDWTDTHTESQQINQARALVRAIKDVNNRYNRPVVAAVNVWGYKDGQSWMSWKNEDPLLIDEEDNPKQVFYAIQNEFLTPQ